MGLFNRNEPSNKPQPIAHFEPIAQPTLDEQSEEMKAIAIEYIVSLDKKDKDAFFEGVELVWQGYNGSLDKVRTRHQKALQRTARANGTDTTTEEEDDDELLDAFLEEPATAPVAPRSGAMDVTKKGNEAK